MSKNQIFKHTGRFVFALFVLLSAGCYAQPIYCIELGDSVVTIESENRQSDKQILFINVHENEATSVSAFRNFDTTRQYPFVWLKQNGTRRIYFNQGSTVFSVDPNRIFSKEGIEATLSQNSMFSSKAARMTKVLSRKILKSIRGIAWVISLHNNTPDNYSILSYLPGGDEAANTKEVFVNDTADADDFIYTTDSFLFNALKGQQINVILQDNENCVNDGSLSVYCGIKGISYANVEAEEGHLAEQIRLIAAVVEIIERKLNR
ncbi:MAG: hypothetical protein HYZ14_17760 [Bacteroidetes bacterium]|nr:hypothetical protein [Bacteroidota bacterium]